MLARAFGLAIGSLALVACVPELLDETTRVTSGRVVAVRATPAEAAESEDVTLEALVVEPVKSAANEVAWSLCLDRKPLSELGPVSTRCLSSPEPGADIAEPLDPEPPVQASLPADACQLFGPERPEPKPGQPSGRPVDPDVTGGFYQPVLAWIGDEPVLGGVRLACPLTGATPETTRAFNAAYHRNTNPEPTALEIVRGDGSSDTPTDPTAPLVLGPEERVTLRVHLPVCADDAESCGGAENYVVYDALTQSVTSRREALVVSFYATDGEFAEPRTEASTSAAGDESVASNVFTLPARAGALSIWAVARDDRGGVGWLTGFVTVTP
jgi:hypothetical protein